MTSSSRRRAALAFAALLGAALVGPASTAFAQTHAPTAQELETARSLYKEGKELRARGDLRGALEKLQAAHALGNTPVTGIELARTYVLTGQIVEAREVCLYIARMATASDETEKSVEARAEASHLAEELRPRIPTLHVRIDGLPAGEAAHLSIDGVPVPDAALTEPQKVDPGKHAVVVRVGEGAASREARGEAAVAEGQSGEVTLVVPSPPVMVAPPSPAPAPPSPQVSGAGPLLTKVGFGAAITGGVVMLVAGGVAMVEAGSLHDKCPQDHCESANGGSGDLASARSWATIANVGLAVGAAGAFVGLIGLWRSRSTTATVNGASLSPWIGVGSAGLDGRF
ncbi:MAG TPA: hypothetical protein VHS09_04270 [Polyangiaceae bacterium]|nr:hypothetical protein [Polyangiaceae bacterium]